MTKWTQQMPLVREITSIQSLTTEDIEFVKKCIAQGTLLDVQFVDASGETMIPLSFTPEVEGDESTTPATISVISGGSVVQANVVMGAPVISGDTPFETKTEVTITSEKDASIFYTTDGSTPTDKSTAYTEAFEVSATTTVKAIAIKGTYESTVASKTFTKS